MPLQNLDALLVEPPVDPQITEYRAALEAAMDEFFLKFGPIILSNMRQAFMAGAMFQLKYKPQEKKS